MITIQQEGTLSRATVRRMGTREERRRVVQISGFEDHNGNRNYHGQKWSYMYQCTLLMSASHSFLSCNPLY